MERGGQSLGLFILEPSPRKARLGSNFQIHLGKNKLNRYEREHIEYIDILGKASRDFYLIVFYHLVFQGLKDDLQPNRMKSHIYFKPQNYPEKWSRFLCKNKLSNLSIFKIF